MNRRRGARIAAVEPDVWRARLVWVTLAVSIVLLVVVASSGPVRVWSDPPPSGAPSEPIDGALDQDGAAVGQGTLPAPTPGADGDSWVMRMLALALGVMLVRWAWIVVRFWFDALRRRREREIRPHSDFVALPPLAAVASPELDVDEAAQLAALGDGTVRNAIVACWLQLEESVRAAGVAPEAAETSAEFTERVLAGAAVDDRAAVMELADLYREARFSSHELGDAERRRAVAALQRVHTSLRRPAADRRVGS